MKLPRQTWISRSRAKGQGVVEYAGAMLVAAMIVTVLVTGAGSNQWIYNSYSAIFNAAGNVLMNGVNSL